MRTTSSLRPCASVALRERLGDALEDLGIGIIGTGRRLADDTARSHEARHIVDMTVGVVVSETLIEPDDLARAEGLVKRSFGLLARSNRCGWR